MSSIITSILASTVGLLCDKGRDSAAEILKDRDLADEKLRELIVRDLDDIRSRLDCLSLKDLAGSHSFLIEGVRLLNFAIGKCSEFEYGDQGTNDGPADEVERSSNDARSGVLSTVMSVPQAMQRLKIFSEERFISAKDCFKASREAATFAFNNKSLSIKDRIVACKLRVSARILESGLEDPDIAMAACLLSLEELHALPTIEEMFTVFLEGGFRSYLSSTERSENVMNTLFINHALFDFASKKYGSQYPNVFTWPAIRLADRTFNPILHAHQIDSTKISPDSDELFTRLNRLVVGESIRNCGSHFAVNAWGEVILLNEDKFTVICDTGKSKDIKFSPKENTAIDQSVTLAVDSSDNVYVVRRAQNAGTATEHFVLSVFDDNYTLVNESTLDFLEAGKHIGVEIAVNENDDIILIKRFDNQVYICDSTGVLKSQFERNSNLAYSLSISDKNEIMIPSDDGRAVHTYTTEGILISTIEIPEGHDIKGVLFHYGMSKIVVLTFGFFGEQKSYFLLCLSKDGELENSVMFDEEYWWRISMTSHPNGSVAVLWKNCVTFI